MNLIRSMMVLILGWLISASVLAQDPPGLDGFDLDGFDLDAFGFEEDSPVQFSAEDVDGAVPGTEVVVKVFATIERGWHIYGFEMDPEQGIPTTLVLAGSGDLELHHDIREQPAHQRDDAILGLVHEHEGKVQFEVPLQVPEAAEAGPRKILIDISYQVCDAKQCLPPAMATVKAVVTVGAKSSPEKGGGSEEVPASLKVEAALKGSPVSWQAIGVDQLQAGTTVQVELHAIIERGWHIYGIGLDPDLGDPTTFHIAEDSALTIGEPIEVTPPRPRDDGSGGVLLEHERKAIFRLPISIPQPLPKPLKALQLRVGYMVCDAQICLPPEQVSLEIPLFSGQAPTELSPSEIESTDGNDAPLRPEVADGEIRISAGFSQKEVQPGSVIDFQLEGSVEEALRIPAIRKDTRGAAEQAGLLGIILLSFGGALVALLTPCVYPMIPITVSVFTKQAHESRSRVLWLAGLFGAGIVVSFTALGFLLSALLGEEGANFMATNGFVNLAIGVLFVVFGFSLFGYYDIQLPSWLRSAVGGSGGGGGAASVLVMGLVFSVTTFTCVGPIVAFLLALAAGEGPGYAAIGMLAFSTTLAIPFVLLALFPKALTGLPRSGGWLSTVKVILGFIELLAAWKFFSAVATYWKFGEVVNREVIMVIWGLTLLALALNLAGKLRFPHDSPVKSISFGRGLLLGMTVIGAVSCFYATTGWRLNENLEAQLLVPSIHQQQHLPWVVLDRDHPLDLVDQLQQIRHQNATGERSPRPIFVNFTGHT